MIAYYVTAHGYGHGVRSCDIIRALRAADPGVEVTVVSDLPPDFLRSRLPAEGVTLRRAAFDLGMVQRDSIRVDVPETLRRLQALFRGRRRLIEEEACWIGRQGVRLVVADLPSIPLEAAARAGVPAAAVGNFAWDWIYDEFTERDAAWREMVEAIRVGYASAALLVRLPFAEEMSAFPRRVDVPLVAVPGQPRRAELARRFGCDAARQWVLLSFTSLEWDEAAVRRVAALQDHVFFTVLPLQWNAPNMVAVDRAEFPFADVIASVDIVVTKPGYGILSECVVNDKPILYAERTDFREYAVLEQGIRRYLRHVHIPAEQLYRGELSQFLTRICAPPRPTQNLYADGGLCAASHLLRLRSRPV